MSGTASGSRAGSRVGRYHLKRLLGRGTTGEVYEAVDTRRDRSAALKLLSPSLGNDPAFREWLQREAVTVGRIQEPHVVPIRDYGELDGQVFIDMPLVNGSDLAALLKRTGVLSPAEAVNVLWQAASALDAAHDVGVIHRGIKPRNILLTDDGFVYLVDFGLAGAPGADSGDPDNEGARWKYCAPELFAGDEFGPAVDVYSLACVLYQSLTGGPPYRADSRKMLANAHQSKPIPRPSQAGSTIPAEFDEVVAKGMAKDPDERYRSTAELATAAYQALSAADQRRVVQIHEAAQQATPALVEAPSTSNAAPTETVSTAQPAPVVVPPPAPPEPDLTQEISLPGTASARPHPVDTRPGGDAWLNPVQTRPAYQDPEKRKQLLRIGAGLVVLLALVTWLTVRSRSGGSGTEASDVATPTAEATAAAQDRLLKLLPSGYPTGSCTATPPMAGALAEVSCGKNTDPDGPPVATYALFPDTKALRTSFDSTVQNTRVTTCPGRIQSPGAWHRTAAPDQDAGMLLCGTRHSTPALVWTNDADLLVGNLRADRTRLTLEQLYTWWSTHS